MYLSSADICYSIFLSIFQIGDFIISLNNLFSSLVTANRSLGKCHLRGKRSNLSTPIGPEPRVRSGFGCTRDWPDALAECAKTIIFPLTETTVLNAYNRFLAQPSWYCAHLLQSLVDDEPSLLVEKETFIEAILKHLPVVRVTCAKYPTLSTLIDSSAFSLMSIEDLEVKYLSYPI